MGHVPSPPSLELAKKPDIRYTHEEVTLKKKRKSLSAKSAKTKKAGKSNENNPNHR